MDKSAKHMPIRVFLVCIIFIMGTVGITAGSENAENEHPIATLTIAGGHMEWHTDVKAFGKLMLSVRGPGGYEFQREFQPGSVPYFRMLDNNGNRFPDGLCTYQLKLNPTPVMDTNRENLLNGRSETQSPVLPDGSAETRTQSGSFMIKGGSIFTEEANMEMHVSLEEEHLPSPGNPDQCFDDDVVIDGSMCVGNDCPCPYPDFNDDTIVLTENNLRIFFDDTSALEDFAANDWRITVNDRGEGGASYFSVSGHGVNRYQD